MREWKPGDLAIVTEYGGEILAIRAAERCGSHKYAGPHWHYLVPVENGTNWTSKSNAAARPLVVIDPEDRDQIERFTHLMCPYYSPGTPGLANKATTVQAALRSLIEPPNPPEPLGLGAVVEDADDHLWIRTADSRCGAPWSRRNLPGVQQTRTWSEIHGPRVLSKGVTP